MKIITVIVGIILAAAGIYCFVTPIATFASVGWIIGIVLLIAGINLIINYFTMRRSDNVYAWDLLLGIITILFSLFILYGQFARLALDSFIIILFGVWILVSGISRIVSGMKMKKNRVKNSSWLSAVILGVLSVLAGIYGFVNPMVFALTIGWIIGFVIILNGINLLSFGLSMNSGK